MSNPSPRKSNKVKAIVCPPEVSLPKGIVMLSDYMLYLNNITQVNQGKDTEEILDQMRFYADETVGKLIELSQKARKEDMKVFVNKAIIRISFWLFVITGLYLLYKI